MLEQAACTLVENSLPPVGGVSIWCLQSPIANSTLQRSQAELVNAEISEEISGLLRSKWESIEPRFNALVRKWKSERGTTSSSTAMAMHPAYQRIIGMGLPVLPLILRELTKELDHWFWALKAISGEDPVPLEHLGRMKQMAADWLKWGREKGYAW